MSVARLTVERAWDKFENKMFTYTDLARVMRCSASCAKELLRELKPRLVICRYDAPIKGGSSMPVYRRRTNEEEVDAVPPTRNMTAKQRLDLAWKRKLERFQEEKYIALCAVVNDAFALARTETIYQEKLRTMKMLRQDKKVRDTKRHNTKFRLQEKIRDGNILDSQPALATIWHPVYQARGQVAAA